MSTILIASQGTRLRGAERLRENRSSFERWNYRNSAGHASEQTRRRQYDTIRMFLNTRLSKLAEILKAANVFFFFQKWRTLLLFSATVDKIDRGKIVRRSLAAPCSFRIDFNDMERTLFHKGSTLYSGIER